MCNGSLKFGMSEKDVALLQMASPMHDIGKVAIPDSILNCPGKLSDEDFSIMKGHAHLGSEMLASSPRKIMQVAALIAGQHHEKYDGTGYPNGLRGEEIHPFARIVALADVYDALVSKRVYKKAFTHDMARSIIIGDKGKHFDPVVVDAFLSCEEKFVDIYNRYQATEE